ncbi:hypothetical protein SteCoe_38395 [Stentor coeruleus]|uniref:Uncharacterized protein n=1 Tax=Stentor coeruleus TaxID=5963 RepID=A0A1R2ALE9_9CILI|nr:hypothetical protein SteCoe_38395 [Stentor coeruleus]
MGNYFTYACCVDRNSMHTSENLSSRINSPCNNSLFIRELMTPDSKVFQFPISISDKNLEINCSPRFKRPCIKRTITNITEFNKLEIKESENQVLVRVPFRRSTTLKQTGKQNFLKRAKLRLKTQSENIDEKLLNLRQKHSNDISISTQSRIKSADGYKNNESYILQPFGDIDVDVELD